VAPLRGDLAEMNSEARAEDEVTVEAQSDVSAQVQHLRYLYIITYFIYYLLVFNHFDDDSTILMMKDKHTVFDWEVLKYIYILTSDVVKTLTTKALAHQTKTSTLSTKTLSIKTKIKTETLTTQTKTSTLNTMTLKKLPFLKAMVFIIPAKSAQTLKKCSSQTFIRLILTVELMNLMSSLPDKHKRCSA